MVTFYQLLLVEATIIVQGYLYQQLCYSKLLGWNDQ